MPEYEWLVIQDQHQLSPPCPCAWCDDRDHDVSLLIYFNGIIPRYSGVCESTYLVWTAPIHVSFSFKVRSTPYLRYESSFSSCPVLCTNIRFWVSSIRHIPLCCLDSWAPLQFRTIIACSAVHGTEQGWENERLELQISMQLKFSIQTGIPYVWNRSATEEK